MKLLLIDTLTNLCSGFRLALGRVCELSHFRIGIDQLMVLLLLDLLLDLLTDLVLALPNPQFNPYALPTYAFLKDCFFIGIYLLAKMFFQTGAMLQIAIIVLTIAPVFHFFHYLYNASNILTNSELTWLGHMLTLYMAALFARTMYLVKGNSKYWIFPSLILVLLIHGSHQTIFAAYGDFWLSENREKETDDNDFYEPYRTLDAEQLMYRQSGILDRVLSGLRSETPKAIDLFFVGFAGYAYEDVFVSEVDFIRNMLDQRFKTHGHSINLVNHLRRIKGTSLATATNLSVTLNKIGHVMNPEEDVLLLYLTSHGSQNSLAVSFWPMALNPVTPKGLNKMLDDAGIKWRIIVISSCYSGSFVDDLKGPTTLVATASAADRKSFGCGSKSEFTYFGEAVFKDQLQKEPSFVVAFRNAIEAIGKREANEKLEPSSPQLVVGTAIEKKLNQLQNALFKHP